MISEVSLSEPPALTAGVTAVTFTADEIAGAFTLEETTVTLAVEDTTLAFALEKTDETSTADLAVTPSVEGAAVKVLAWVVAVTIPVGVLVAVTLIAGLAEVTAPA